MSHHSLTDILSLKFSDRLKEKNLELQNTAFRSMIMLKSDNETLVKNLAFAGKTFSIINKIPCKAIKRFLFTLVVTQQYETNTFLTSYIGKADFSGCTKYVKSMRCDLDTPRTGIVMEICAINDSFYVDVIMDSSNPKYLDAFCDELTKQRIHHWCGKITPLKTPKCRY